MYIHVGENQILKTQDLIGIFDVDCLKQSRNNLRILNMLKSEKKDIKSVIIVEKNHESREHFSIVSTRTLRERVDRKEFIEK